MGRRAALIAVAVVAGCRYETPLGCSWVCIGDGVAATAPHCGNARFPMNDCDDTPVREAIDGEDAEVRSSLGAYHCRVQNHNWLGFVVLDCVGNHGDSGSGVFGKDGKLLGIVDRNQAGSLLAEIPK